MKEAIKNFKKYLTSVVTMDDEVFNLCVDLLRVKEVKKGDYFIKEGRICRHIAYVDKGIFRIYYLKDGNEINTCFCKEDSIASSFESFVSRTPSKEYIKAIEAARLVTLSYENLMKLYELNTQWQSVGRLLTEKECLRLSNRTNSLSFETAMEKYKNLLEHQPEVVQRVPIQDIASYLGVSRETLSRIRSKIT